MFFLGFLIAFVVLILAISLATKLLPKRHRSKLLALVVAIPVSFPFWHYLYPSYHQFQELCSSAERYVVKRTVEVDFINADRCWNAFEKTQRRAFKGFECPWQAEPPAAALPGVKPYARFVRGENWATSACQDACTRADYYAGWERECLPVCFKATQQPEPSFKYAVDLGTRQIVKGRLTEGFIQFVDSDREELATLRNYTYYPYGNGFAKILGLASGNAPTVSCEKQHDIFALDFLKPNTSR